MRLLLPDECILHLRELEGLLQPAFGKAHGELKAIDALVLAGSGKAYVFVGSINGKINVAVICEFIQYPRIKVCNVIAYAGKARNFFWFWPKLKAWALANDCDEIRGSGDDGAMRLARRYGFEKVYNVYAVSLA